MKKYTLDEVKDQLIGNQNHPERERYEQELRIDLIGEMIRKIRKEKTLTQAQLGEKVGVQKAQISRLENSASNMTISTISKVFEALGAKIEFKARMINPTDQTT